MADDSQDEKELRKQSGQQRGGRRLKGGGGRWKEEGAARKRGSARPVERLYKPTFAPGICFQWGGGGGGHLRRDCPKKVPLSAEYPKLEYTCYSSSRQGTQARRFIHREIVTLI